MKIAEYLMSYGNDISNVFSIECSYTVDNTDLYVLAGYVNSNPVSDFIMKDYAGASNFLKCESVIIDSVGISLPVSFTTYSPKFLFSMHYVNNLGDERSLFTDVLIPFGNFEVPINHFFKVSDLTTGDFRIGCKVTEIDGTPLRVSMLGVPDSLNGEIFTVQPFIKVIHNGGLS